MYLRALGPLASRLRTREAPEIARPEKGTLSIRAAVISFLAALWLLILCAPELLGVLSDPGVFV
jgi:hypothetical protein